MRTASDLNTTETKARDAAALVGEKLHRSMRWMQDNFYPEYEQVTRQYYGAPPPIQTGATPEIVGPDTSRYHGLYGPNGQMIHSSKDSGATNRPEDVPSFYAPDQWALNRRKTARATSNIPNLRFVGSDWDRGNRASRTCMWQWDNMGRTRDQKRHVSTGFLYGWSVKMWHWVRNMSMRTEKLRPETATPEQLNRLFEYYGPNVQQFQQEAVMLAGGVPPPPDEVAQYVLSKLMEQYAVGNYIRYRYPTVGYVGPRFDTMYLTSVFPQPNTTYVQEGWLCLPRRRNRKWLESLRDSYAELAESLQQQNVHDIDPATVSLDLDQINAMLADKPNGTRSDEVFGREGADHKDLERRILKVTDRSTGEEMGEWETDEDDAMWTVIEVHHPDPEGGEPRVEYCGEGSYYFGRLPYTFDLGDGMIPATELVFVDSMLPGPGDSSARVLRRLVEEHGKHESLKSTLVRDVLRPLCRVQAGADIFDNPNLVKRGPFGTRIIESDYAITPISDQQALAAISAGMSSNQTFMQLLQYGSGESNTSAMANVDPQQARTATGARIMAFNQDVLSQDELMMLNVALRADVDMMRRLNRSELVDELTFDESPYMRGSEMMSREQRDAAGMGAGMGGGLMEAIAINSHGMPAIASVTPEDFQIDGVIEPEIGSTLAEDDELNVHRAQLIWQVAMQAAGAGLINMRRALAFVLTSLGQGKHINEWIIPESSGPVEPPPAQTRLNYNVNLSAKDLLDPANQLGDTGVASVQSILAQIQKEREAKQGGPSAPGGGVTGSMPGGPGGGGEGAPGVAPQDGMMLEAPGARGPDTAYEAGAGKSIPGYQP